jgi:L-asparaginase
MDKEIKKKICVIFTGGTIGSSSEGGAVNLSGESKKLLLDIYRQSHGDEIKFDTLSPIDILSENVQAEDLDVLSECVDGVDATEYDGIIITHGTDTLCFTANYFSQIFADSKLPIVFVSALYPLKDERSNGPDNFAGAVDFIEREQINGVFVSFKNGGERCKIHLGSRLVFSDELNGYYHSAWGEHFAEVCEDGTIFFPKTPHNPSPELVKRQRFYSIPSGLCRKLMMITARSLLNFSMYDFTRVKPKAVIVELYHSGTVGTKGKSNFLAFAAYCKKHGVPLVIAPVDSRAGVYGSMSHLPDNVIISYDITLEMTVVKMMSALAQGLPVDAYFHRNVFFEKI